MSKEIDVTGETCPRPALVVRNELEDMNPGDVLQVTADYPPARDNIQRTCRKHGYEIGDTETTNGDLFTLEITVTDEATGPEIDS